MPVRIKTLIALCSTVPGYWFTVKLLMVGYDKSGTSSIFKQAKFQYKVPFSKDECENLKHMIQSNLYSYIGILLEERERFEVESMNEMRIKSINQPGPSDQPNSDQIEKTNMYSISRRLQAFSDWLLQVMMSGNLDAVFPASTREYAPLVKRQVTLPMDVVIRKQ